MDHDRRRTRRRWAVGLGAWLTVAMGSTTAGARPMPDPTPASSEEATAVDCLHDATIEVVPDQAAVDWAPSGLTGGITVVVTGQPGCVEPAPELKVLVEGSWLTDDRTISGGELRTAGGVWVWALPALGEGDTATMHVPIAFPTGRGPGRWTYVADVRNENGVYHRASTQVAIAATCADVQLDLDVAPVAVAVGRPTTAVLTATNAGSCDLTYPVPIRLSGTYRTIASPTVVDGGTLVGDEWTLTSLAPGASASITWAGTAATEGRHWLLADVLLAGDPDRGNRAGDLLGVVARPVITGTVTSHAGGPVAGARVVAFAPTGAWFPAARWTLTAPDGTYTLDDLPQGGLYKVLITHPSGEYHRHWIGGGESRRSSGGAWGNPGAPPTVADAVLQPVGTEALDATVTGPGGDPRADVWVAAFDQHGFVAGAVTAADGRTVVDDLAPGTYWVRAWPLDATTPAEWYLDAPTRAAATGVPVSSGTVAVAIQLDA